MRAHRPAGTEPDCRVCALCSLSPMPYKGFDQDAHLATPKRLKREWHALILRCTRTRAQAQMAQPTLCYSIMAVDRLAFPTLAMVPIAKNPERVGLFSKVHLKTENALPANSARTVSRPISPSKHRLHRSATQTTLPCIDASFSTGTHSKGISWDRHFWRGGGRFVLSD